MHPDTRALLWDAQQAGRLILVFLNEVDLDRYLHDALIASAVERQLTIIGESLNRLAKVDPPDGRRYHRSQQNRRIPQHLGARLHQHRQRTGVAARHLQGATTTHRDCRSAERQRTLSGNRTCSE